MFIKVCKLDISCSFTQDNIFIIVKKKWQYRKIILFITLGLVSPFIDPTKSLDPFVKLCTFEKTYRTEEKFEMEKV